MICFFPQIYYHPLHQGNSKFVQELQEMFTAQFIFSSLCSIQSFFFSLFKENTHVLELDTVNLELHEGEKRQYSRALT